MDKVQFLGKEVSKLIVGDNPFNGHSYIVDKTPGSEMTSFYTEDKILETMHQMEELGINTMLPIADPYIIRVLQHYRNNGGKMNFIFQTFGPYMTTYETAQISIRSMMSVDPLAIYLSGTYNDVRFETGRKHEIVGMLECLKTSGVPVGLGTHRPDLIEYSEEHNWDPDFYFACMYNARRNREGEESGFITGKSKARLVFYPDDRQIMLSTLQKCDKPVIAFKIFAGGQMFLNKTPEQIRAAIKDSYNTIFNALKPNDIAAFGVFQRDKNELAEDVEVYEEWFRETHPEGKA